MQSEIFQAFTSYNCDDYVLQRMKPPNLKSQKIRILHEINNKRILNTEMLAPLKRIIMNMYSVLGLSPLSINYCLSAAWHGCYQLVALLRCYGVIQLFCIVRFHVSHLSLGSAPYILYGVQVR